MSHDLATGAYITPSKARVTLDEFVGVYLARQVWKPGTADAASTAIARVSPVLGARPLGTIRKGDVQAFIAGLSFAPSTIAVTHQHLSALLEAAMDDGHIATNPARRVKLPEQPHADLIPPTMDQVATLYAAAPEWFRSAIVLGAGCGLRQGEVSGPTVDRIDFLRRTVRVDRQWISAKGPVGFGSPKTSAATRTVPASDVVLEQLGSLIGRRTDGFAVTSDGQATSANRFGTAWRGTCRRSAIQDVRFHDLRQTFTSGLISAGCSVKAVASALGHSNAAMTLRVYSHLWPGDEDRIRQAVDVMFRGPAEDWRSSMMLSYGP